MKKLLFVLAALLWFSCSRPSKSSDVYTVDSKALRGYDVVAYFKEGQPVPGADSLEYEWHGVKWYFSTAENLSDFKKEPSRYAPQYGGYCAFGVSNGYKAPTQPDAWTILDGKLYLNYNTDVRNEWLPQKEERIKLADENWKTVRQSKD